MKRLYLWQDLNGLQHSLIAESLQEAKLILLQQGEFFFRLKTKGYITSRSFNRHELIIITKQLATMLKAGLPIIESLTLLANEHSLPQWQWVLNDLKANIITGESFSQAIGKHEIVFPPIYKEIVATGELTGQLEECFEKLAHQLENTQILHKRIKKALRYPIFLLSVSIIVTLIMLLIVLPKFADVYKSFDAQLPGLTQGVICLSEMLQHYFLHLIIFTMIIVLVYQFYIKKYHHHSIAKHLLNLPILGNLITTTCITQVFQTLSITQKSGIPLLSGLHAAQKTAYNQIFKISLSEISHTIEQGNSFSQSISKYRIYPDLCFQLILVGEESGTLDLMLEKLAEYYQQKSEELSDNLAQKIEPVMMSIMAIIIGTLVIAMYLPIFQLGNVIH